MTTPQIDTAEQMLERMLTGDPYERFLAHGQALNAQCGGLTVVDDACCDDRGRPLVLVMADLHAHLAAVDSAAKLAHEDGVRLHTPANVHLGSGDDGGYGPALGRGGTTVGDDL